MITSVTQGLPTSKQSEVPNSGLADFTVLLPDNLSWGGKASGRVSMVCHNKYTDIWLEESMLTGIVISWTMDNIESQWHMRR
jgi:hypothetical protein